MRMMIISEDLKFALISLEGDPISEMTAYCMFFSGKNASNMDREYYKNTTNYLILN